MKGTHLSVDKSHSKQTRMAANNRPQLIKLGVLAGFMAVMFIASARPALAQLDFGSVKIGMSKSLSAGAFCPAPPGSYCLPIAAIITQGPNASEFTITNNTCIGTLSGQASCSLEVIFTPKKPSGAKTATLLTLGTEGQVFISTPLLGKAEGTCKVDDLTPITDSSALQFEAVAPNTPTFSLFFPSVELNLDITITSFLNDLYSEYGVNASRNSGYRPFAYQEHFYELRTKLKAINEEIRKDPDQKEACKELKERIDNEIDNIHGIPRGDGGLPKVNPAATSSHTFVPASAVDLSGVKNLPPKQINEIAELYGLYRPCGLADPVHFALAGTPCSETVRGRVESPVNILITDPKGRKVGFDPGTNAVVNQVGSSAFYSGPGTEPQDIEIGGAIAGSYVLTGIGTGTGPYKLTLERIGEEGQVIESKIVSGNISLGENISLNFSVPVTVRIDIKPDGIPNSINPKSKGVIAVAILSSAKFDATKQVVRSSLTFGRTGTEQSLAKQPSVEDVNRDGLPDLVCHFNTQSTGFQSGDAEGILQGKLTDNTPIRGVDWVRIVP